MLTALLPARGTVIAPHRALREPARISRHYLATLFLVASQATFGLHAANEEIPRAWAMYFGGGAPSAISSDASGNTYILAGSYSGSDLPASAGVIPR